MSSLLGLPPFDPDASFDETFEEHLAPRLAHRADGFRAIFGAVKRTAPTIVETGCLRALGNWHGDGQSTFLFEAFATIHGGATFSIDLNHNSIVTARRICARTELIRGDGAYEIHRLVRYERINAIDLLYLDSFDYARDVSHVPAPVHYAVELAAAWPALRPGSVVAVDDFHSPEIPGGPRGTKGLAVEIFFDRVGAEVVYDGYQKVWVVR